MKYDMSNIMKNAWVIRRMTGCTMSDALIKSWADAKAPKDIVSKLLAAGGRRWTKNGRDRIYISRAISSTIKDNTDYSELSRKRQGYIADMIESAYYDVVNSKLVYTRRGNGYEWMNEYIENGFAAIAA